MEKIREKRMKEMKKKEMKKKEWKILGNGEYNEINEEKELFEEKKK
jgi:hypothetical protein